MRTTINDQYGQPLSGASPAAADAYNQALDAFRCLRGDPLADVQRALDEAPNLLMGHVLKAWLLLTGTEPAGIPLAREALVIARTLSGSRHERAHLDAAEALAGGQWRRAGVMLEDIAADAPGDLLALQVGHQIDFFRGDSRMLRDRIARALPAWRSGQPGYHALLGMYAFGLEECGDYLGAERTGRQAVEMEPLDAWAWHAVAHVHEMRGEIGAGIAWLNTGRPLWGGDSFLAPHNLWHLALFHLQDGDSATALRLYDEAIGSDANSAILDFVDASALLWRLRLLGIDAGPRWQRLADRWQATGVAGQYAFNDVHALLAQLGAGREEAAERIHAALCRAEAQSDDNADFSREVGRPLAESLLALHRRHPQEAARGLRDLRQRAQRFGGSHAQRDLVDLTLLDAVARAGDDALVLALVHERRALRPGRPLLPLSVQRLVKSGIAVAA
jgi:tetratricopeptide (TPR) repeat protein